MFENAVHVTEFVVARAGLATYYLHIEGYPAISPEYLN